MRITAPSAGILCAAITRGRGEMAATPEPSGASYGPGHADHELERLKVQARLIEPITRRWFTAVVGRYVLMYQPDPTADAATVQ
jgi:hypothetical protein